jgi:tRNA-modifying protein YgfZ
MSTGNKGTVMTVETGMRIASEPGAHSVVLVPAGADEGIAWHYGDPFGEQRALATTAGVIDRGNRGIVTVAGVDRLSWLHSIITQYVSDLDEGKSTESLVLSPHGHVEQHWQLTELEQTVWIDVEPGTVDEALKYLTTMRFLKRIDIADVSADWSLLTLQGPMTRDVLRAAELPLPAVGYAAALPGGGFVRDIAAELQTIDLVVPRTEVEAMIERLVAAGAARVGAWAFDALRVQTRRPRLRFETDHRTIAHEVGWIGSAVHLNKGCYRGQETVARVQNLGKPPRRLVLIHFDGSSDVLPVPGTPLEHQGRTVGFVGTAVQHYELGPIGLAVIKRSLPADADLRVGDQQVSVDSSGEDVDDHTDVERADAELPAVAG